MYIEFPLANCCSKSQRISSLSIRSSEPLTAPAPVRFRGMNWVQRKIFLYNVTFGLYMLDWWERCLFNILVIVLMWFIFYNSSRYVTVFLKGVTGQSAKPVTMAQDVPHGGLSIRRGTFSSRELARFKELLEKPIRLKFGWPDNKDMAT